MTTVDFDALETSRNSQSYIERRSKRKEDSSQDPINEATDDHIQSDHTLQAHFTRRQLAQIQLTGIMNDPELSLPYFVNDTTQFELEGLATRLRTQPWLIKRLLHTLGIDSTDWLSASEVHTLTRVLTGSFDARVLLFFNMIDNDNDQQVTKEELLQFFSEYLDGITSLKSFNANDEGTRRQMVLTALLDKFHLNQVSHIDFDQFHELVLNDELLIEILSRFSVHPTWFDVSQKLETKETKDDNKNKAKLSWTLKGMMLLTLQNKIRMYQSLYDGLQKKVSRDYFYDNFNRFVFLFVYLSVTISLCIYSIILYVRLRASWLEVIAHICGLQLDFNCMLMIVLMLRYTGGLLRSSRIFHKLVPVDDAISIHKMVGRWIGVLVFIHALFHMIYFGVGDTGYSWAESMFTARAKIGWLYITPILGIFLTIILCIMIVFSLQFVRRGAHFEAFYITHLLYIVFYILLILHARNFWHWFIGPGVIFILEKIYYLYKRHSTTTGHTLLHSVAIEQANVVKLTIHRPPGFHFKPGDYVLLNIPQIARYEWHPFTLTSAPEDPLLLTVHVQSAGNWTGKVLERYKEIVDQDPKTNECDLEAASTERVWLDGPYASSARHVFDCSHVILIGAGIGITPYASILSSLLAQYRDRNCCGTSFGKHNRLVKVDFVWVNRSLDNFEWFLKVLANFEHEQDVCERLGSTATENTTEHGQRFLDLHLYFTDIKQDVNVGSVPLDLITRVYEETCHEDVFTRLKTKTNVGRPDWDNLFETILAKDSTSVKKDVGVFFCGPKSMSDVVKTVCRKHKIKFHKEQF